MRAPEGAKYFRFKRGPYSVIVTVLNKGEHVTFDNIIVPVNTSEDIMIKLLDDAETAALAETAKEEEKAWSSS